jgi:hypothetical protein
VAAFAWLNVVSEEQFCYGIPGPAQSETIVPIEVFVVESYLDCFLDEAVHESYGDATSP